VKKKPSPETISPLYLVQNITLNQHKKNQIESRCGLPATDDNPKPFFDSDSAKNDKQAALDSQFSLPSSFSMEVNGYEGERRRTTFRDIFSSRPFTFNMNVNVNVRQLPPRIPTPEPPTISEVVRTHADKICDAFLSGLRSKAEDVSEHIAHKVVISPFLAFPVFPVLKPDLP